MKLTTLCSGVVLIGALAGTATAAEGRGSDGELRIQNSQAPSILNPYLSTGAKDSDPASLVLEPMAYYDADGQLVPALAENIPTIENGGVSEDLRTITWTLKEGLLWSDGTEVTSADVVFSGEYCLAPDGGCSSADHFSDVESIEAIDEQSVRITFSVPKPYPYGPFVSAIAPILNKAQFEGCKGAAASSCSEQNFYPIGTGPYVVEDFRANDVITYTINEYYREADKPAFSTVTIKGGGDAMSAARSVLETGEYDFSWNIQAEPEIIEQLEAAGRGKAIPGRAGTVERLFLQLTNIDPSLGDKRGTLEGGPHPIFSDVDVRKALSLAINRQAIVDVGYGKSGRPACNIVSAPEHLVSQNNWSCLEQQIDTANALLDEAGWVRRADGVREKDGVRLSLLFQTATNSVRQSTQALIKQNWEAIGVETELRALNPGVLFSTDPASPDTYTKFNADIEMFSGGNAGGDAETYLSFWSCDSIPSPETQWLGQNVSRFCSEEYDQLLNTLATTADSEERASIIKQMNDILVESYAAIPLVHRALVSAVSNSLENVEVNDWDSALAFVEDWSRAE